ncbi:MAG: hypothetical protein KAJ03_00675 [Gammaproteobacteria bacterium]|nr:hypothetical protein [Gammaproteobacteria bacterium]
MRNRKHTKNWDTYSRKVEARRSSEENIALRNKVKRLTFIAARAFYNTIEVEAQLYRGQSKFPRTAMMTIQAMAEANRQFVLQQIKRNDQGRETRLWLWRAVDREGLGRKKDVFIMKFVEDNSNFKGEDCE